MRNLKRALSLALSSVMLLGMMVVGTSAASYPDVDAQDNLEAIEVLQMLGVMKGDEKGNFNPDNKVTRNEMAVIMTHLLNLKEGGTNPFTDVPTWAQPYVSAIYANGVTSGTSATTYGGSNNVTATEAALMVMKALGYFGYQGEFGDNWTVSVVKQATKIGLFDGVNAAATSQITRSEAAQICLNALEATVQVVEEQGGMDVDGNGISVSVKPTYKYTDVANSTFDYTSNANDKVQQLCEKLYGEKLKKDTTGAKTDDFGRPAAVWTYSGKTVTAPKAADATYTAKVDGKTMYTDLGLSANLAKENVTTYTNGKGNGTNTQGITKNDEASKWGANGTLTQVYLKTNDKTGDVVGATVVVTETVAGKITGTGKNSDGDRIVKVDGLEYKTEAFATDDIVLYTVADGKIKSMSLATKATSGEVTRMITTAGKESITIGGTEYKQAHKLYSDKGVAVKGEYDLYVDAYGYAIYAAETKAAEAQYAVVIDVKAGGWSSGNGTAKIVLADGTQAEVEYKNNENIKATDIASNGGILVAYTVKDNVYTFTTVADKDTTVKADTVTGKITSGNATLKAGLYADSKTVFIVRSGDAGSYTYTAYTGIKNVPNVTLNSAANVLVSKNGDTAKLVYVTNGATSTDDGSYIYITTVGAVSGKDADNNTFYTYNAVVNGKVTTVDVVGTALTQAKDGGVFKSASYNKDGQITNLNSADKDKTVVSKADGTDNIGKYENETIVLEGVKYSYTSDVKVFVVDKDGKITESNLATVADDKNDTFVATLKDGAVTALYVVEVAD